MSDEGGQQNLDAELAAIIERLLKRTFSIELHFALLAMKINEVITEYGTEESVERHAGQLAHVMESFFETAKENGSRVTEALDRMRNDTRETH